MASAAPFTVEIPYSFYGNNKRALYCKDREVMLAGPADTGKTITLLTRLHILAYKYPDASIVIARNQLADTYSTVLQTFQNKILSKNSPVSVFGGKKPQWFDYPNGSRIWVAGLDKPGKVLSAEHDVIYVNQAEEVDLPNWETLTTRTTGRAGHVPNPQTIGDCNPDHPAHWILSRGKQGHLTIINSTHKDNPDLFDPDTGEMTKQGKLRLGGLRRLTGSRLQRLFHGLWIAPEGAIYGIFDEDVHVIEPIEIRPEWPKIVGIDPFGSYIVAIWFAFDIEARRLLAYREYSGPFGASTSQHAKNILDICMNNKEYPLAFVGGGPSERQARVDFTSAGLPLLEPPNIGVESGISKVIKVFEEKTLYVTSDCTGTISDIGGYRRKMVNGFATDEIIRKGAYHYADALRYAMAFLVGDEEEEQWEVVYNPLIIA